MAFKGVSAEAGTQQGISAVSSVLPCRTVARKISIGGLCSSARGAWHYKINQNSTYLRCFIFQFGGLGALFGEAKPIKAPRGDGTAPLLKPLTMLTLHPRKRIRPKQFCMSWKPPLRGNHRTLCWFRPFLVRHCPKSSFDQKQIWTFSTSEAWANFALTIYQFPK